MDTSLQGKRALVTGASQGMNVTLKVPFYTFLKR